MTAIIKLFDINPLELAEIWFNLLVMLGWLVLEGKVSVGSFFSTLIVIMDDLRFFFGLPFYIWILNIFGKKHKLP
ncbi:MAG: hypothetical protein ACJAS6_000557 [Rickettsiales bacterium]|jgi:hypothetical protein